MLLVDLYMACAALILLLVEDAPNTDGDQSPEP